MRSKHYGRNRGDIVIKLVNIHKMYETEYGGFLALKDVNLDFSRQEFVSVLGKSGSGKTTLLNIIGGLDRPSVGHMVIDGQLTSKFTEQQWDYFRNYKIGFIFQNYSLIEHLSVLDNVMLSIRMQGEKLKEARTRALELLERVGVLDQADKLPKHLSGGQRQRVAIARALINDPEIILADEPTGSLDKKNSKEVLDLLKTLSQDKLVIMVTHNRRIAKQYSDRIIELKDGEVLSDTRPDVIEKVKIRKADKIYTTYKLVDKVKHGFKNLWMKKVRTILTALGLAIGVCGYILVNALTNGLRTNINRQRQAYNNNPTYRLMISHEDLYPDIDVDSKISTLLEDNRVKAVHRANDAKYYMTGLDEVDFVNNELIDLHYMFIDNPNESNRYFGRIYEDGHWPEKDDEIVITLDVARRLYDYSSIDMLWNRLKGSELHIATDFYFFIEDRSFYIDTCATYSYIDEETVPDGYNEEKYGSFFDHIEKQKDLFSELLIRYYGSNMFIEICENYFNLPLKQGAIKDIKTFKIVGIIESNHISNSIVTESAYHDLFHYSNYDIYFLEAGYETGFYKWKYQTYFHVFLKDDLTDLEKAQFKDDMSEHFDYIQEYVDYSFDLPIYNIGISVVGFVMNLIMFVSVITAGIMLLMVLSISVMERSREIGILRALGATRHDILSIFTVESGIIGILGGMMGIVLSIMTAIGGNIIIRYRFEHRLLEMFNRTDINLFILNPSYALIAAFICVLFSIIFGLFPALRASRKSPINALRRLKQSS